MMMVEAEVSSPTAKSYSGVTLSETEFGFRVDNTTGKSELVHKLTWRNDRGMSVEMITYGATIVAMRVPDRQGNEADVVMGFDDMRGYQQKLNPYFGATVGRVANRVGNATINIDGKEYKVSPNLGKFQLHGGYVGFDKVIWSYYITNESKVVFSHISPDNDEGYPGAVIVNQTCELTKDSKFLIDYEVYTTKPTFVNLTNHSYFNLAGHDTGAEELYKHTVCINADRITDVDNDFIPNGKFLPVRGTVFDLQVPKVLGDVIDKIPTVGGYDHNFCVNRATEQGETFIARVEHPPSGRILEVYSNQPGVQFYTSNSIPENPETYKGDLKKLDMLIGKKGAGYFKHGALCLETQNYPDAINHKNFPKAVLYPGEKYYHSVVYKFLVDKNNTN